MPIAMPVITAQLGGLLLAGATAMVPFSPVSAAIQTERAAYCRMQIREAAGAISQSARNGAIQRARDEPAGEKRKPIVEMEIGKWQMRAQESPDNPAAAATSKESVAPRFRILAEAWKRDTRMLSSSTQITTHPAYREVIRMGWAAVPHILEDLRRDPALWFAALNQITGCDPVPTKMRGRVSQMASVWVAWGRSQGVLA